MRLSAGNNCPAVLYLAAEKEKMSKKLFVGSLSWGVDGNVLREAFSEYGEITDSIVIADRETGRSRGFGFVTFADNAKADLAIQKMNGAVLDGRTISVNEAKEKAPRR